MYMVYMYPIYIYIYMYVTHGNEMLHNKSVQRFFMVNDIIDEVGINGINKN